MAKRPATLDQSTRIAVLIGPDPFLREQHTAQLRATLEAAHGTVDMIRFEGPQATVSEVLDECRTFGLMVQHKLVVVDDADQFVKESTRPALSRYAESPADNATLVLRTTRWHKGNLDKLIEKVGAVIKCEPPSPAQATAWSVARCTKRHAVTLDRQAAGVLVQRVGPDLARIDAELAKLAGAVGEGGTIESALVTELVASASQEDEVWPLQATLLRADPAIALAQLRDMLDARIAPTLITYACLDLTRKLHAVVEGLAAGQPEAQIARDQKLWGPSKDGVLRAARQLDRRTAAVLLHETVASDARQKSGRADPERAVERLVVRIPSLLRATGR